MNQRIRELAEQAGIVKILDEHAHEYGNGMFENTPYPELEKFAELIVQECMDLFDDDPDSGTRYTGVGCRGMIKHYFGVEE